MNFHYLFQLELSSSLHWYRYGNLGVQLFFIISGFVIVQSLKGKTSKEFAVNRFIRLFPLFWIICTVTYIVTLIVPGVFSAHLSEYFINMTMFADPINEYSGNHLGLIDPSYWTLTVEIIFYIAIGVFTFLFSDKHIRYFLFFWLLVSVAAFIAHIDENFYMKLALVRHAPYFIFGGALALIATKQAQNIYERLFDLGLLLCSAGYAAYIHPRAIPPYTHPNVLDSTIVTGILIIMFLGIFVLVHLSRYITNSRIIGMLLILGGLTYPLYLLHQTIGNIVINYATNTFSIAWDSFAIFFEVCIILVAYAVFLSCKNTAYATRIIHTSKKIANISHAMLNVFVA